MKRVDNMATADVFLVEHVVEPVPPAAKIVAALRGGYIVNLAVCNSRFQSTNDSMALKYRAALNLMRGAFGPAAVRATTDWRMLGNLATQFKGTNWKFLSSKDDFSKVVVAAGKNTPSKFVAIIDASEAAEFADTAKFGKNVQTTVEFLKGSITIDMANSCFKS